MAECFGFYVGKDKDRCCNVQLHLKADVPAYIKARVIVAAPNQEVLKEQVACPEPSPFAIFGHSTCCEHKDRKDDVVYRHYPPDSPPKIILYTFLDVAYLTSSVKGLGSKKTGHGQEYLNCEEKLIKDTR